MLRNFLVIVFLFSGASQGISQVCVCERFETLFKDYRAAKDNGNSELAEEISWKLATSENPTCRSQGFNLLANVRINKANHKEGLNFLKKEKAILDSMRCRKENYLDYFLTKSYFHYSKDEYDSSIANSLKALEIAELTKSITRQITLRLGIGSAFYRTGQLDKKMEYSRSIIPLIELVEDPSFKCQFYFNLFGAYYTFYSTNRDEDYLDSANMYNLKSLEIAKATLNKRFLPYCYEALEIVNSERGGNPSQGLVYLDSALYFGRNSMNSGQLSELLLNKAGLYQQLGQRSLAILYADSALFYSSQNPQKSVFASHLVDASDLFSSIGDHKRALELHKQADIISDSLKSSANARVVRELEEKYNNVKNEKTISQLNKEKEVSKLQIRLLVFSVIIAIVIILLIVVVYRLSLLKQKQKAFESKYRLNQALINPHFLSNALVSIQRYILENKPQEASNYLTKFSRLMRKLLESSYQATISIEEEIDLLRNYLDIQKLRLKDSFSYTLKVAEDLDIEESHISPMFVQPFLENAIEHGVEGIREGKIDVVFSKRKNFLEILITDNGKGFSISKEGGSRSLSTMIIQERIELLNKTSKVPVELTLEDRKDESGFQVRLVLPIYS